LEENATLAFSVILKNGQKAKRLFADPKQFGIDSPIFKTSELVTHAQKFCLIPAPGLNSSAH
jgi:hypothetical protein